VVNGRPGLDEQRVRELADGRVWSAPQALELGFIDRIGTLREAIDETKVRIGVEKVRVVAYQRPSGYKPNIYADAPVPITQYNMMNITLPTDLATMEPEFLYLWSPGL